MVHPNVSLLWGGVIRCYQCAGHPLRPSHPLGVPLTEEWFPVDPGIMLAACGGQWTAANVGMKQQRSAS